MAKRDFFFLEIDADALFSYNVIIFMREKVRESPSADSFVATRFFESRKILINIT